MRKIKYIVASIIFTPIGAWCFYEARRMLANREVKEDAPEYVDDTNPAFFDWIRETWGKYWLWATICIGIAVLGIIIMKLRSQSYIPKDGTRLFTQEQKNQLFLACGARCEHHMFFFFRCRRRATDADHIYPHTLGGTTTLNNAQGLCKHHNSSKGGKVPSNYYLWKLKFWRKKYWIEPQGRGSKTSIPLLPNS